MADISVKDMKDGDVGYIVYWAAIKTEDDGILLSNHCGVQIQSGGTANIQILKIGGRVVVSSLDYLRLKLGASIGDLVPKHYGPLILPAHVLV